MSELFKKEYNPDVLSCIANLSNDEVFTPPELVNQMLDMLPEELWRDPSATFLDPACKSGVFLREIAKRLIDGLADEIPDLEERLEHIYRKQLFGIAITELTSLLSRRSVYCSKWANGPCSVVRFDDAKGNIDYLRLRHTWKGGRCKYCGAAEREYKREEGFEQYAYEFIHLDNPEEVFNMKFDVIVGNPPYQLSTAGASGGAQAKPVYHLFVNQAKQLSPRFLVMVVPARWYSGGWGLDSFRNDMLGDGRIRVLHDFPEATDCFPGVQIKGGVCYFMWDRDSPGLCDVVTHMNGEESRSSRPLLEKNTDVFIRYNNAVSIFRKVRSVDGDKDSFSSLVSAQKPFGIGTAVRGEKRPFPGSVELFERGGVGYINPDSIPIKHPTFNAYKVFVSAAYGAGDSFPHQILGKPILGKPETCCTETYVAIGPFESEGEARNALGFIQTRTFRFLVMLSKTTQHALRKVYSFVPGLDMNEEWTDEKLYLRYGFDLSEIAFIESMIRPMDLEEASIAAGGDFDVH